MRTCSPFMHRNFPTTLCTTSSKKLREWEAISRELHATGAPQFSTLDKKPTLIEIQDLDVVQVVITKALDAYRKLGYSVLVEDSGYEIDVLGGFPGALYASTERTITNAGFCKLLEGKENRNVKMKTAIGFADEAGGHVHVALGELSGTMPHEPQGPDDFGYDNILIPANASLSLAQMSLVEKNAISARRIAIDRLLRGEWSTVLKSHSPLYTGSN